MARGGARAGAGRKKGSTTQRTREIADKAASDGGVLPLDVLIAVMRFHFGEATTEITKGEEGNRPLLVESFECAREAAKDAAPYMHPRLQAIEHTGKDGGPMEHAVALTDTELARKIAFALAKAENTK